MEIEPITFGLGLNLRNSSLYLKDGELVSCEGFDFANVGVMDARGSKQTVNENALGSIHSIHRYRNHVLVGDDGNLRYKWDLDGYCNNYVPPNGNFTLLGTLASEKRWKTADYAGFTFIATENDMYAFGGGYYFNCSDIVSPSYAPAVTSSGGSGTPADHTWYYTYVFRFGSGHQYETGLSPGKTISANPTGQTATINVNNSTRYPLSNLASEIIGGNDAYVMFLFHFDGSDEATTTSDSSSYNHSITLTQGDQVLQLDTDQKKFGTASLRMVGTWGLYETSPSYVTIASDSYGFDGAGNIGTLDFWVRFNSLPDNGESGTFFRQRTGIFTGSYSTLVLSKTDDVYYWTVLEGDTNQIEVATTLAADTWYHMALVEDGAYATLYQDGVALQTVAAFGFGRTDDINIGNTNGYLPDAWIDELRWSKGIARWSANFSPPSVAYSTTTAQTPPSNVYGVELFWKAYKTADAIGGIYECYNGIDVLSTTGTDSYDDSTVLDNALCTSDNYGPWPTGIKDVCVHLQRLFGIKENKLYWSEPYLPFAVDAANYLAITPDGEDLTSLVQYGTQVFVSSASTWYRLTGTTSATWAVQETFAEVGTINRHTVKKTPYGIIGLWHDGIWMFDGLRTRNITDAKIGQKFFDDISDKDSCFAEFHNNKYYFYYPSTGTTCDKCLMIDFSNVQDMKFYHDNFVPNAFEFHVPTGIKYCGDTDGYQYAEGGSEVIATSLQTGDKSMKAIMRRKQLLYLFYDINTGGKDVTISVYVDGTSAYTFTLNKSSRVRDRYQLPKLEGYRFSITVTCSDSSGLYIYEPWGFGYSLAGE